MHDHREHLALPPTLRRKEEELNRIAQELEKRRQKERDDAEKMKRLEEERLNRDGSFASKQVGGPACPRPAHPCGWSSAEEGPPARHCTGGAAAPEWSACPLTRGLALPLYPASAGDGWGPISKLVLKGDPEWLCRRSWTTRAGRLRSCGAGASRSRLRSTTRKARGMRCAPVLLWSFARTMPGGRSEIGWTAAAGDSRRDVEALWEQKRLLLAELNMKQAIIDMFVPQEEVQKVMKRAAWDNETETWRLERLGGDSTESGGDAAKARRPMSASNSRRPTSAFAKAQILQGDLNPRFKSDNILKLVLDMPERTTFDYDEEVRRLAGSCPVSAGSPVSHPPLQTLQDPRVIAMIQSTFVDGEISFAVPKKGGSGQQQAPAAMPEPAPTRRPQSARKKP